MVTNNEDRKRVDFHPERFQIVAVCLNGVLLNLRSQEDELNLLDLLAEYHEWKDKGIDVPPIAICLCYGLMHLLPELERRLAILRATSHLNKIGRYRSEFHRLRKNR